MLLNQRLEFVLVGSAKGVEQLASLEELERGHAAHISAIGKILESVNVNVDKNSISVLLRQRLERGSNLGESGVRGGEGRTRTSRTILQGPHHSAEKSTMTSLSPAFLSASYSALV